MIPARGGSKSVGRKNLRLLAGAPLLAWTIGPALAARSLDRVIVSTDDAEIAEIARGCGAEVPFVRPAELAADGTPDLPVFRHALDWLAEHEHYVPDAIAHLRPTQPLRTAGDIDSAVALWRTSGADCVKSVLPVTEHPFKMYRMVADRLAPYLDTHERRQRGPDVPRQSLEALYLAAGVVDVVRREVLEAGSTEGAIVVPWLADPSRYVNLDSERDFAVAESLMRVLTRDENR